MITASAFFLVLMLPGRLEGRRLPAGPLPCESLLGRNLLVDHRHVDALLAPPETRRPVDDQRERVEAERVQEPVLRRIAEIDVDAIERVRHPLVDGEGE